ncbi:MAG: glycosyltransferase [Lentisphaerae bacterium]|nr:glycosyltransferase [Lentisphaerota bacterium]
MTEKQQADVAAIIPVYNGRRFLRQAIESVISQTVQVAEIMVVDDGSTDGSLDILGDIQSPVPITAITQKNAGQSAARNKGVSMARSRFIALLDQDDYWYPRHVDVLMQPLLSDPSVGWVYSNLDQVMEDGSTVNQGLLNLLAATHPKVSLQVCLSEEMFILPSAALIRKEAFDRIGGFDERLSGYEDDDLFLRMFRAGYRNVYVNEALSAWRLHPSSSMHSARMVKSRQIYAEKLYKEYPDQPDMNLFYSRDCLAPKFYRLNEVDYWRGVRQRNPALCREARLGLKACIPHFDNRWRAKMRLEIMRFPQFMKYFERFYGLVFARPGQSRRV